MDSFFNYDNIPKFIVDSTEAYYNYLIENEKGRDTVKITKIVRESEYAFVLYLEHKIPNFDFITEIHLDGKIIKIDFIQIKEAIDNHISVLVREQYIENFVNYKSALVVVDFTNLVWQIRECFINVRKLSLPLYPPQIEFNHTDFSDVGFTDVQLTAIQTIFNNPISYIWGGAGSGKTRYVLTYSIINYMLKNTKVLLVAPTNIALENALSEIIPVAKKYGIKQEAIMRGGIPSVDFAKKFPHSCKNRHLEKELKQLSITKEDLQKYLKMYRNKELCHRILNEITSIKDEEFKTSELKSKHKELSLERNLVQAELNSKTQELYNINDTVNKLQKKQKSIIHSFFKKSSSVAEAELNKNLTSLTTTNKVVIELKEKIANYNVEIENNDKSIDDFLKSIYQHKKTIKKLISKINPNMDTSNFDRLKNQIEVITNEFYVYYNFLKSKYPNIDFNNIDSVKTSISSLETKINEIFVETKTADDDDVLLCAYTLDGLARNSPKNYKHIFLDEACYSNIAKTSLLYLFGCPITFLGDHQQLPPVSEIDDDMLINKDNKVMFLWSQNGIYSADLFSLNFDEMYKRYMNNIETLPDALSVSFLTETHRFGSKLAKVLDKYIYKNNFTSALNGDTNVVIINAPKTSPNKKKRQNINEVIAIQKYIFENNCQNYAILTPYKNQVELIKHILPLASTNDIYTIHKSQGQEWDTVFISVVDTDDMFFTNTNNKLSRGKQLMNTAISRAKKTLVIACDIGYWKSLDNQLISELIDIGEITN